MSTVIDQLYKQLADADEKVEEICNEYSAEFLKDKFSTQEEMFIQQMSQQLIQQMDAMALVIRATGERLRNLNAIP